METFIVFGADTENYCEIFDESAKENMVDVT